MKRKDRHKPLSVATPVVASLSISNRDLSSSPDNITHANQLYEKAKSLSLNLKAADEHTAKLIIEIGFVA